MNRKIGIFEWRWFRALISSSVRLSTWQLRQCRNTVEASKWEVRESRGNKINKWLCVSRSNHLCSVALAPTHSLSLSLHNESDERQLKRDRKLKWTAAGFSWRASELAGARISGIRLLAKRASKVARPTNWPLADFLSLATVFLEENVGGQLAAALCCSSRQRVLWPSALSGQRWKDKLLASDKARRQCKWMVWVNTV